MNGRPSRVLAILRMFGEIAARSGRRAERTLARSDRADRPNPNIVFSRRGSFQRRGHLTVSEVESYRLTLPRTLRITTRTARRDSRTVRVNAHTDAPGSVGHHESRPHVCMSSFPAHPTVLGCSSIGLGQKLDQLYFQTYPLNARFPGFCVFNPTFSFSFEFFRFQIRLELFDSDLKKFNFDDSASRFPVSTPRSCQS